FGMERGQRLRPFRSDHDRNFETARRLEKGARPIRARRHQEQRARHSASSRGQGLASPRSRAAREAGCRSAARGARRSPGGRSRGGEARRAAAPARALVKAQPATLASVASFASVVTLAFSARETGQPFLAASTAPSNLALSAPGTRAVTRRWIAV